MDEERERMMVDVADKPRTKTPLTTLNIAQLNEEAWRLKRHDEQRAIQLAQEAYNLAVEQDDVLGQAHSLRTLSFINERLGKYGDSLSQGINAVTLLQSVNDTVSLPDVLITIGASYMRLGEYAEALSYLNQAQNHSHQQKNLRQEAKSHNALGNIYFVLKEYENAFEAYQKAADIYIQLKDVQGQAMVYGNLIIPKRDKAQSLAYAEKALTLVREQIDMPSLEANILDNVGLVYLENGEYDKALEHFHTAIEIFEAGNFQQAQVEVLLNIGKATYRKGDIDDSLGIFQKALQLAENLNLPNEQSECHYLLSRVYKQQNLFEQALYHHEQHHDIQQQVFNQDAQNRTTNLEILYRTEAAKREADIYRIRNEELAKLNADKDRFFSIVAHDLRSPFLPLLSAMDMLSKESLRPEDQEIAIDAAHRSAYRVYGLLENLLEWAQLEMGRMPYSPQLLNAWVAVEEVVSLFLDNAFEKEIIILNNISSEQFIIADQYMFNTIMRNLISNALKFTHEKGTITVEAQVDGDVTIISVSDTGIGMNDSDAEKLFQIGQHHSTVGTANERGSGLGLVMCQQMIQQHGGEIWVETVLGEGTTFLFTMPRGMQ